VDDWRHRVQRAAGVGAFDAGRQPEPFPNRAANLPSGASWQLPGSDSHRQAMMNLRPEIFLVAYPEPE
jgi:hypothetical protein